MRIEHHGDAAFPDAFDQVPFDVGEVEHVKPGEVGVGSLGTRPVQGGRPGLHVHRHDFKHMARENRPKDRHDREDLQQDYDPLDQLLLQRFRLLGRRHRSHP